MANDMDGADASILSQKFDELIVPSPYSCPRERGEGTYMSKRFSGSGHLLVTSQPATGTVAVALRSPYGESARPAAR